MTRDHAAPRPTDAELVAYLDGELSPADSVRIGQLLADDSPLRSRLDHLMSGGRPFRTMFDPLLAEAPIDRLEQRLATVLARPAPQRTRTATAMRHWRAMVAAAVLLVGTGIGVDRLVLVWDSGQDVQAEAPDEWRAAVAGYLSLYTSETLAALPGTGQAERASTLLKTRFGLDVPSALTGGSDLGLKRVDLYDYDGKPLAFLAYLDPQSGPVALCVLDQPGRAEPPRLEQRLGLNVVYWVQGHHSVMLIGRAAAGRLEALAARVRTTFDAQGGADQG